MTQTDSCLSTHGSGGQANAPRRWYLCVLRVLTVDDTLICCLRGFEHMLHKVQKAIEWGSAWEKDGFMFVGRRFVRQADNFTVDQAHYVADISLTKVTLDHPRRETVALAVCSGWLARVVATLPRTLRCCRNHHQTSQIGDLVAVNKALTECLCLRWSL